MDNLTDGDAVELAAGRGFGGVGAEGAGVGRGRSGPVGVVALPIIRASGGGAVARSPTKIGSTGSLH